MWQHEPSVCLPGGSDGTWSPHNLPPCFTILFGPGEDLLKPGRPASSSGKGQHLDAVVGVFLQPIQL